MDVLLEGMRWYDGSEFPCNPPTLVAVAPSSQEPEAKEEGPYSQLTRSELIALLLKQQAQLAEQGRKMLSLEEYIDNLLVRVMEEKPSILMDLSGSKKAV